MAPSPDRSRTKRTGKQPRRSGSYVTSYEVKNNELVFKRRLSQRATTIAPADYETVRKFFESIRAAENAPVVLAKQ